MKKLLQNLQIDTEYLTDDLFTQKGITLAVLRLDKIHPIISGNKLFKLQYLLQDAIQTPDQKIITFGGAFSNHLVATAFACRQNNLSCIGIVRGERPVQLSHTLHNCLHFGMELQFVSRQEYSKKEQPDFIMQLKKRWGAAVIIPEGGYHPLGAKGAAAIMNYIAGDTTHIACATGTATTLAGLVAAAKAHQQVLAFPALKGCTDTLERLAFLNEPSLQPQQLHIETAYHFGGYAKHTPSLIAFMNQLYEQYQLPTDFVYTAKMMYGVLDLIKNDFFKPGSNIVCVHTGGLQGNLSLQKNLLTFG